MKKKMLVEITEKFTKRIIVEVEDSDEARFEAEELTEEFCNADAIDIEMDPKSSFNRTVDTIREATDADVKNLGVFYAKEPSGDIVVTMV